MTIGRSRLSWESNILYFQDKAVMSIIPDISMFRVQWEDKTTSVDYYNKTRAKDHAVRVFLQSRNIDTLDSE